MGGTLDDAQLATSHRAVRPRRIHHRATTRSTPTWPVALHGDIDRLERELRVGPGTNSFEGPPHVAYLQPAGPRRAVRADPRASHRAADRRGRARRRLPGLSLSSIAIGPGETAQPIHADDQLIPLAKPHAADGSTACGRSPTSPRPTAPPGSSPARTCRPLPRLRPAVRQRSPPRCRAGSVLVWHGSLWHGGGANTTDERRVGIAMNYCAGWVRQQENQQLGIPLAVRARVLPRAAGAVRLRHLPRPHRPHRPRSPAAVCSVADRASATGLGTRLTMYRFLLRPKWIAFHLLCAGGGRADGEPGALAAAPPATIARAFNAPSHEPTSDVARSTAPHRPAPTPTDDRVAPGRVSGSYLPDEQVIVVNRSQGGEAGFNVVTCCSSTTAARRSSTAASFRQPR